MPYPTIVFNSISDWENYVNTNVVTNGMELITGVIGNNSYNGAVKFIKQSPLNWGKASVISGGGVVSLSNNFLGVAVFTTITPTSLSFGDNFYNQYVFINMTDSEIPLGTPSVYYDISGNAITEIAARSVLVLFKTTNDLWVQGNSVGGGASVQKEPKTYVVGTTPGAPTAGQSTWTLPAFENSYVKLWINYGVTNQIDTGNGSPYISKGFSSDELTINNYDGGWKTGDVLDYILITS